MEASRRQAVILSLVQTGTLMMGYLRARSEASAAASARRGWAFLQALERRLKEAEEEEEEEEEESGNESPEETPVPVPVPRPRQRPAGRRPWVRPRSTEWWDRTVLETWTDQQWLENFRMRKATFVGLCAELAPALQRQRTRMRIPLSVEKRVAITLWKLATSDCYRSVGNQFGVGRSTAGAVVLEVCRAIQRVLLRRTIEVGDAREIAAGFQELGFPHCAGALSLTHMPIQCPPHQASEYINGKGYYSMALQVLVDHRGRFTNISTGWPGKAHEARILRKSTLFKKGQEGALFPPDTLDIDGLAVPMVILGDVSYPLLPWLMTPYPGEPEGAQEQFNEALSRCRQPVEQAVARLKGRWRCLTTRNDCAVDNLPRLISACCILHNICERKDEVFDEAWGAEARRLGASFEQPEKMPEAEGEAGGAAAQIRDALCTYLESQF